MLAMTLHPDVMRRAQASIDLAVGRERMPGFADREKLPYIEAMVKEVLRWRTPGPLAVPRRTTQVCISYLRLSALLSILAVLNVPPRRMIGIKAILFPRVCAKICFQLRHILTRCFRHPRNHEYLV